MRFLAGATRAPRYGVHVQQWDRRHWHRKSAVLPACTNAEPLHSAHVGQSTARVARSCKATTSGKMQYDVFISSVRICGARGRRQRGSLALSHGFSCKKAVFLLWRRRACAHAAQGEPLRQRRPDDHRALTRRGCHTREALRHALRKKRGPRRQRIWRESISYARRERVRHAPQSRPCAARPGAQTRRRCASRWQHTAPLLQPWRRPLTRSAERMGTMRCKSIVSAGHGA